MENTTLVIDEKEKENAKALSQSFVKSDVKSRAFINALGAEVCLKYLRDENIVSGNVYNMHNIRKILEEFDISDIMLSNIHIDVRVVYNDNKIFIPKRVQEYIKKTYITFTLGQLIKIVKIKSRIDATQNGIWYIKRFGNVIYFFLFFIAFWLPLARMN